MRIFCFILVGAIFMAGYLDALIALLPGAAFLMNGVIEVMEGDRNPYAVSQRAGR